MRTNRIFFAAAGALLFAAGVGTGMAVDGVAHNRSHHTDSARTAEAALERAQLGPAEQVALMRAVAESHLERKDYGGAIAWAQKYLMAGGIESEVRPVLIQAYSQTGDYANAARELQWEIQEAERAGRAPAENRLLMLRNCYTHLKDAAAYIWSLEKLVTYHPKRDYWAELLERTEKRPGFNEVMAIDVNRLRLRTQVQSEAPAYLTYVAQAQDAGLPAEARAVVALGIRRGVLGTGPEGQRHRLLLQQLTEAALTQQRLLSDPRIEMEAAAARDGIALAELGFAHFTLGSNEKGLQLMEQGIRKGLARRPQIVKLRLGIAYILAGQKVKAIELLKTVTGKSGAADLGRIWAIHAQQQ